MVGDVMAGDVSVPHSAEQSKTAAKILDLLVAMSDGEPVSPQRLSVRTGMNRTVTQRLLTTLLARGFVRRNAGSYVMTPRVRALADAVMPRLRAAVEPVVSALSARLHETVVFQIRDGADVVVLAEAYPQRSVSVQVRHEVGARSPIYNSASGLAILSACSPGVIMRISAGVDSSGELAARLAEFAETGFATSTGDVQAGVSGLAVPVRSSADVVGSLAILVPSGRAEELESFRRDLRQSAHGIEDALGD